LIALHTLIAAWWPKRTPNLLVAIILVTLVLLFVVLFVAIGVGLFNSKGYEAPTVRTTHNIESALPNLTSSIGVGLATNTGISKFSANTFGFGLHLLYPALPIYRCISVFGGTSQSILKYGGNSVYTRRGKDRPVVPAPLVSLRKSSDILHLAVEMTRSCICRYPLVYSVLVLPLSVARSLEFKREWDNKPNNIPGAVTFTFASIYSLSGFANVVLFLSTRPDLLLFQKDPVSTTDYGQLPLQETHTPNGSHKQDSANMGMLPPTNEGGWDLPASVENHEPENV